MANQLDTDLIVEAIHKGFRELGGQLDDVADSEKKLGAEAEKATRAGSGFSSMLSKLGPLALGAAAAIGGALVAGLVKTIQLGSDAEEQMGKFNVVFGEAEGGADAVAASIDDLSDKLGRNSFELKGAAASFGDLLKPMGFAVDDAAALSGTLTELAVDLGSFNNMPMDEALQRLQGTLVGSHENALAFGVVINENVLKQELAAMGADKFTGAMLEQAKVQARINLLLRGTTDAQGDAIRTADSFANQTRQLTDAITEAATEIGQELVPIISQEMKPVLDTLKNETLPELVGLAKEFGPEFAESMATAADSLSKFIRLINSDNIKQGMKVLETLWKFTAPGMAQALKDAIPEAEGLNDEFANMPPHVAAAKRQMDEAAAAANRLERAQRELTAGSRAGRFAFDDTTEAIEDTVAVSDELLEKYKGMAIEVPRLNTHIRNLAVGVNDLRVGTALYREEVANTNTEVDALSQAMGTTYLDALTTTNNETTLLGQATGNLEGFILDQAAAAGISATEMLNLAVQTGLFTDEQIEAAIKAAEFEVRLEALKTQLANGEISASSFRTALQNLYNIYSSFEDRTITLTIRTIQEQNMGSGAPQGEWMGGNTVPPPSAGATPPGLPPPGSAPPPPPPGNGPGINSGVSGPNVVVVNDRHTGSVLLNQLNRASRPNSVLEF